MPAQVRSAFFDEVRSGQVPKARPGPIRSMPRNGGGAESARPVRERCRTSGFAQVTFGVRPPDVPEQPRRFEQSATHHQSTCLVVYGSCSGRPLRG